MRELGEPRDRCSLGANIHEGPVVIRTDGTNALKSGDRLIVLNQVNVAGQSADAVIAQLRDIDPTTTVPVTVDRNGELLDLQVPCANARTTTEPIVNALSFAAKGKFDDCVAAFNQVSALDTRSMYLKAQCAAVSRNAKKYGVPNLVLSTMQMAIEDARFAPTMRADVVKQLRNVEGMLTENFGSSRFQELVSQTRAWPGGEDKYDASEPDWALFRRNSESMLRARLIDPDSARIEWPYGFLLGSWKPFMSKRIDGYWTCGLVNARNRMGGYTGSTYFVVVLDPSGHLLHSEIGESKDFDITTASCNNSVKLLPPAPRALRASATDAAAPPATTASVADEIRKLLELKESGALSEAEFQAAKQKLLGTPSQ